jgi:hypothetical protein
MAVVEMIVRLFHANAHVQRQQSHLGIVSSTSTSTIGAPTEKKRENPAEAYCQFLMVGDSTSFFFRARLQEIR